MAKPGTLHALIEAADRRDAEAARLKSVANRKAVLSRGDRRAIYRAVLPYVERIIAQDELRRFSARKGYSIKVMRSVDATDAAVAMRMEAAHYLKGAGFSTQVVSEMLNRNYDTIRYYIHERHRKARRMRYYRRRAVHFVRFDSLHDQRFQNAVRVFGQPDFLHRVWDQRARREISKGDLVVFAKGGAWQAVTPFNGDDEAYQ